jgi:hypothetical protein
MSRTGRFDPQALGENVQLVAFRHAQIAAEAARTGPLKGNLSKVDNQIFLKKENLSRCPIP